MKTSWNSRAGFAGLLLLFGCIILFLFALGAQGIYTAVKNRKPVAMSCEDYSRTKPETKWISLTNCVLDLRHASFETWVYQNVEVPAELFIPVYGAGRKEPTKCAVLLATRDPEFMKTLRDMAKQPSEGKLDDWVALNTDRVFPRRDVQGLVQFGVELDTAQRRKIARLQDNLAPDFIMLEDGKMPEVKQSVGYIALGTVMIVISVVFARKSRDPHPGETY